MQQVRVCLGNWSCMTVRNEIEILMWEIYLSQLSQHISVMTLLKLLVTFLPISPIIRDQMDGFHQHRCEFLPLNSDLP
jgi:hypothetical protein